MIFCRLIIFFFIFLFFQTNLFLASADECEDFYEAVLKKNNIPFPDIKKNDLARFMDDYGRQFKHYEGKKFTKNIGSNFIKFKKPKLGKKRKYNFKNLEILLEVRKNLKNLIKKDDKTTLAILDGGIVDNNGQNVISYGEIVKTSTLRILSDVFEIRKPLTILRVSKKINSTKLERTPIVEGELKGIKGQYLLLDGDRVFNIRSHEGYISKFSYQEIAQGRLF